MLFQKHSPSRLAPPPALAGKKLWLPRLQVGSSRLFAAVFRSIGVDAEVLPPSDERTRELGARHSCGDECYPLKLTLGDCLKVLESAGQRSIEHRVSDSYRARTVPVRPVRAILQVYVSIFGLSRYHDDFALF